MELNLLRSAVTVLSFLTFLAIVWRAWRRADLEQAGHNALHGDDPAAQAASAEGAPR